MKIINFHSFKKVLYVIISCIIILTVVVIIIISPITKYLITKYDEKYTGRQITLGRVFVNPITGYIHLSNIKIHELNSDSIFFSAKGVSAKIGMLKLFTRTFEISRVTLDHPYGIVIQNKKDFNFKDLIDKFSSSGNPDTTRSKWSFNILHIKMVDGEFHYLDQQTPVNYFIKKVNITSAGKFWDTDTIAAHFSFLPGTGGGNMNGDVTINLKNENFRLSLVADKYDLNLIEQYIKDLTYHASFSANLDANVKAKGTFKDRVSVALSGKLAINALHFGKSPEVDFLSFDKLELGLTDVDPDNLKYIFDTILVSHPYVNYEVYDYLDNLQRMFGKGGSRIEAVKSDAAKFNLVIEIARYVKVLAETFFQSDYKINHLEIQNGDIRFNDFSTSEKFAVELNPLTVIADSIDRSRNSVNVTLESKIKPYGNVSIAISLKPLDSSDFDLHYHLLKLPVSMFNPYTISYTSFPLDGGTIEFNGDWHVRKGIIKSNNHLVIVDPAVSKRVRNKDTKWIPLPLIMAFVRERGNYIDYEIPITGNLKSPKFHVSDVIFDLIGNIFIKPPSTPYIFHVKNVENEIEKSITLKWEMKSSSILPSQGKFIETMADFLVKNPETTITVYPQEYSLKEKEYILFFEAKKKYFLKTNNENALSFNNEDSLKVDRMSVKDSLFSMYLRKQINDSLVFTIQEKCTKIIDSATVNSKFDLLNKARENAFMGYFKNKGVEKRVKIFGGKTVIPYNGFSFYKIDYKGGLPESLIKAYNQMNEINSESSRKKFKQERKSANKALLVSN